MALADTSKSIGAVTQLLHDRLLANITGLAEVTVGRPEPPKNAGASNPHLNLFLYEVHFDGHLKNVALDEQQTPLWLVLKYMVTAFDKDGESDTVQSHEFMGDAIRTLQGLNFFPFNGISAAIVKALKDNPDLLKLTFDDASPELLSKLMQGTDEKYRCSVCFQVRPVMIANPEPPSYSLLVGIDYQNNAMIGEKGIRTPVLPSLGPVISEISPEKVEAGDTFYIEGTDLNLANLVVQFGPVDLPALAQQPNKLRAQVSLSLGSGATLAAGGHVVAVVQALPTGHRRSSNFLVAGLLPLLTTATPINLQRVIPADLTSSVFGDIDLTGNLLGRAQDDVFAALWQNDHVVRLVDTFTVPGGPPPQTQIRISIPQTAAVPPGDYRLILRVNGEQARNSPLVTLVAP